jgi:hypothetical protein
MKRTKHTLRTLVLSAFLVTPVSAQSSGAVDRLGRAIDRVMDDIGNAFDRGESGASWSEAADDFSWSGRMPGDGVLEVKGINGPIVVERARGSEIVITAQARGRRSDASSVRIELVEHSGGLTFCAVYPTPESARHNNECAPGSAGQMSTQNNDVEVRFSIMLPDGVSFEGRTVNGDIEAFDLESDVSLASVNGDVDVSTTGSAEATTVNGSIDATMGTMARSGGASFSTVNGSITLDLPDDVDADIDASWLNGGLDSDLPIHLNGGLRRNRARGALGQGGAELILKTVNGSIRIR